MKHLSLIAMLTLGTLGASCAPMPAMPRDAGPLDTDTGDPKMAAFTFTADNTTDLLTIVGHGLLTGDGPAAVRNVGGTLPAATPALGPVLDRFVIRIDADHLKLAESNALAMAGTPINITSNGTGTNILEVGQPYRRARTYANGSILFPADLNGFFDADTAVYDLLTGQAQSVFTGVTLAGALTASSVTATTVTATTVTSTDYKSVREYDIPGANWKVVQGAPTYDSNGLWTFQTNVTDELVHELNLVPGTLISALSWSINRNSNNVSGEFQLRLFRRSFGSAPVQVFSDVVSSGTGFTLRDSIAGALAGVAHQTVSGSAYWMSLTTATTFSGAPTFDGVKIITDRI